MVGGTPGGVWMVRGTQGTSQPGLDGGGRGTPQPGLDGGGLDGGGWQGGTQGTPTQVWTVGSTPWSGLDGGGGTLLPQLLDGIPPTH